MKKFLTCLLIVLSALSCNRGDLERPEILSAGENTSPLNCQEFVVGSYIPFAYTFSDNVELGAFNIEIHNNFEHHDHDTEGESEGCGEEHEHGEKKAVNPFIFNKSYDIEPGLKTYEASLNIPIPDDVDTGEYHFMIRVTDAAGGQTFKALTIHIEPADV